MSVYVLGFHESLLAPALASRLGLRYEKLYPTLFADGEFLLSLTTAESILHVVLVVDFLSAGNELMHVELLAVIVLLRQLAAQKLPALTLVMPYLPYGRADRLDETPVGLLFEQLRRFPSGLVVTVDVHNEQVAHPDVKALTTDQLWLDVFALSIKKNDVIIISPDAGGAARAQRLGALLQVPYAVMTKERNSDGDVLINNLTSNVAGKTVLLRDDIVDTGKTASEAVGVLRQQGAGQIFGLFTHAVLSSGAAVRLQQAAFDGIFFTNSLVKLPLPFAKTVQLEDVLTEFLQRHLVPQCLREFSHGSSIQQG